ncbi:MAG: hypothetical protein WA989_12635 [Henriciella sp.]|uniref:hypothetical protein n=1 Tax=Henriciella sp. TaxID=1968823 RepID=UPI003C76EFB5
MGTYLDRIMGAVALCLSPFSVSSFAHAQEPPACEPTLEAHAYRIKGETNAGELSDRISPEIYGNHSFYQALENGWVFSLQRAEEGWTVRLYESEPVGDAVDLTSLTPPHGGAPNPRDIYGWHFRNQANTGPNTGDVNAPGAMRAFVVSPALEGTGGYRPSADPETLRHTAPAPGDGIGWLHILEYGLRGASLEPGSRASMNYLKFDACVSWRRTPSEQHAWQDVRSFEYVSEERELIARCGLDLQSAELDARYLPRQLGGDIDGDGAGDEVVQIKSTNGDKRGLALCRAGTWISVIGLDGKGLGDGLPPGAIDQIEDWHWISPGEAMPRSIGDADLPEADGDILLLERIEKSAVAVYWKDGALRSKLLYHLVEPS